ncbi:MAG: hypothetical protein ACREOH_17045 [Candidatus Entotheonellia bacterium]
MTGTAWVLAVVLLATLPAWAAPVRSSVEAQALVRGLLAVRTPTLQVGPVREVGPSYEVEVATSAGSLIDRLLVDKASGTIRSLYGQMLLSFQPWGLRPPSWGARVPMGWGMGMMGWGGGATAWGAPWTFNSVLGGARVAPGPPGQAAGLRAQLQATMDQTNRLLKALLQRLPVLGGGG